MSDSDLVDPQREPEQLPGKPREDEVDLPQGEDRPERVHIAAESFVGPLPHPESMAAYAEIQPDLPDRLLRIMEFRSAATIEGEQEDRRDRRFIATRAINLNAVISALLVIGGTLIAIFGPVPWLGGVVGGLGPLSAIAIQALRLMNGRNGES